MKKITVPLIFLFISFLLSGCGMVKTISLAITGNYKPLIVEWPNVVQQTNIPMIQGASVYVIAPSDVAFVNVVKTSDYGTTAFVFDMPAGKGFYFSVEENLKYNSTITINMEGFDRMGHSFGVVSHEFNFSNSGYTSNNHSWKPTRSQMR